MKKSSKEKVIDLISNAIDTVEFDDLKFILSKSNNLGRYDAVNRLLIQKQFGDKAFDIRTEQEWFNLGRKVREKAKPIFIVYYEFEQKYIDTETGADFENKDLNRLEIQKALEYGIIKKETRNINFKVSNCFDISQTLRIDKKAEEAYDIPKVKCNISDMLEFIYNRYGIEAEESSDCYFSTKQKKLYIKSNNFEDEYKAIVDCIINCEDIEKQLKSNELDISNDNISFIKDAVQYTLESIYGEEEFNTEAEIDSSDILKLLGIVDYIAYFPISLMKFEGNYCNESNTDSISIQEKAEVLLNIYEALCVSTKLKTH